MKGFLLVADRETNIVLGAIAPLDECRTENQVAVLCAELQQRLGDDLKVIDSRTADEGLIAGLDPATGLQLPRKARDPGLEQRDLAPLQPASWLRLLWR